MLYRKTVDNALTSKELNYHTGLLPSRLANVRLDLRSPIVLRSGGALTKLSRGFMLSLC